LPRTRIPESNNNSAWWGESFVTELRRISATTARKVRIISATGSRPATGAAVTDQKAGDAADGLPPKKEDSTPTKDKESDPAVTAAAHDKADDSLAKDLPLQPKKSATQ
jgi:trehalose 6-phosphate synthase